MNKIEKHRLASTALFMVEHRKDNYIKFKNKKIKFNMGKYMTNNRGFLIAPISHECGTSCCFAGFSGLLFPSYSESWVRHIEITFGSFDDIYSFLFNSAWPSNIIETAKRALFFLDKNEIPGKFAFYDKFYKDMEEEQLICWLKTYIIKSQP